MGEVVNIERRKIEALALEMVPILRTHGALIVDTAELENVGGSASGPDPPMAYPHGPAG